MPRAIIVTIICFLSFSSFVYGRGGDCQAYNECLIGARNYLEKGQLEKARKEFMTAKILAKECGVKDAEADKGIEEVIEKYRLQTVMAEKALKAAEIERKKTKSANQKLELQLREILAKDNEIERLQQDKEEQDETLRQLIIREQLRNGLDTSKAVVDQKISEIKRNNVDEVSRPDFMLRTSRLNLATSGILSEKLFAEAKNVIDSVGEIYSVTHSYSRDSEHEAAILLLLERLDDDVKFNIVAKHLTDSSRSELTKFLPVTKGYDFTVYTYLRAVLYYSWNLSEKGRDSLLLAKKVLDEAVVFCNQLPHKSAIIFSGMAGLYNGLTNYYMAVDSSKKALNAIMTAVSHGTNAVRINSGNYLYQKGLANLLNNVTYVADSQLSLMDKVELSRLSYKCLRNLESYFPYTGNSLDDLCNTAINLSNRLMNVGLYFNAADTLKRTIEFIDTYVGKSISQQHVERSGLKLLVKTSIVYLDTIKDFDTGLIYLNRTYSLLTRAIQDSADNTDVDQLVELNSSLDNLLKYARRKQDTISAFGTYSAAIQVFERIAPLRRSKYQTFSEDIYRFAQPYVRRMELSIINNNKEDADKDFAILERIFFPYFYKYRFDFYLGQPLIKASKLYANFLCEKGKYEQALPLLKFASLEGIKESTDSLIAVYQMPGYANVDSLSFYKNRASYQSNGMKRFTIPTDFNGKNIDFNVYISDKAKEYDTSYTGIRNQARWVLEARGGNIPSDVVATFDRLQKIAWENNVSFQDLSVYAIGSAQEELVLDKAAYKNKIREEKDPSKKLELYEKLISLYEEETEKEISIAKNELSQEYSNLGWECLIAGKFKNVILYFEQSLKYNKDNIFAQGNLAHAYLFTGQFERAKDRYLSLKDIKIDDDSRFTSMKEAFLDDFKEFEKAGIENDNIQEIIRLLN